MTEHFSFVFTGEDEFERCSEPRKHVWFDGGHTTEEENSPLAH